MTVVSLPISCATKSVRRPNCAPRLKLWVSNSAPSHRPDEFLREETVCTRQQTGLGRGRLLAQPHPPGAVPGPRGLLGHSYLLFQSVPGIFAGQALHGGAERGRLLFLGGRRYPSRVSLRGVSVRPGAVACCGPVHHEFSRPLPAG